MRFDIAPIVIWIFELPLDQEIRALRVIRILLGLERTPPVLIQAKVSFFSGLNPTRPSSRRHSYSAVAGRIERFWISGPIVFTAVGFILGPDALGVLRLNITGEGLRFLAELTLAMVLFTDAANLIGLPLTDRGRLCSRCDRVPLTRDIGDSLMAAMLAPTDAALGKPVVTNGAVPAVMREALNLESGLNDGICVPIVVLLLGLAVGTQMEGGTAVHVARVVIEEIGIGAAIGLALTWLTLTLRFAEGQGWISEHWVEIRIVALAAACFAAAQAAGGSGFIACFVGGGLGERHKKELLRGAEHMGEALV